MLKQISRNRLLTFWFAGVVLTAVTALTMGVSAARSTTAILLALSLVPPAIVVLLWRPAPPTVAEILYAVNTPKERRS